MTSSTRETRWRFHFNPEVGSRVAGYVYSHVQLGLYSSPLYVYGKRQQRAISLHRVLALVVLYTSQVLLLLLLSILQKQDLYSECRSHPLRSSCGGHMLLCCCSVFVLGRYWLHSMI